jgi:hypothetical protein
MVARGAKCSQVIKQGFAATQGYAEGAACMKSCMPSLLELACCPGDCDRSEKHYSAEVACSALEEGMDAVSDIVRRGEHVGAAVQRACWAILAGKIMKIGT